MFGEGLNKMTMDRMLATIKGLFSIDARSLGLFRISLGVIILSDLAIRAIDLKAHYTDEGILPRDFLFTDDLWHLSVHMASGSFSIQAILFLTAFFFGFLLLIGYYTRTATIVSWFLLFSLHIRNPLILNNGDILLRLLLFWAMFLPLGIRYSIDSILAKASKHPPSLIFSAATIAILLQIVFVYLFGVLLKDGAEWRLEGSAVYYALNFEQMTTSFGIFLLGFPTLLMWLTHLVFWFEVVGPLLLFTPFYTGPVRVIAITGFFLLHLGIGLSLHVGIFPWVSAFAMTIFLPAWFWEKIEPREWFKRFSRRAKFFSSRFIPPSPYLANSDKIYSTPVWLNVIVFSLFLYVLFWNVADFYKAREGIKWLGNHIGVNQRWNMFAPRPVSDDGWYVMPATLLNGEQIDIGRGGKPVSWEKPPLVSSLYPNQHWQKYMQAMALRPAVLPPFASYMCRQWNEGRTGEERVKEVEMFFMYEKTLPDYQFFEPKKIFLWKEQCKA